MIWLLLFFLPSQLGFHFWPDWAQVYGVRIDYLSPTVYMTDLIILIIYLFNHSKIKARLSLLLIILITLNIFFSQSPFVSLYKWLRLYEYYWLFKYLLSRQLPTLPVAISALGVVVLTWSQFIVQHSIGGIWYWLGERTFNISTIGIAKTLTSFGLVLRPYATFPHPNALAAFLLVAALLVWRRYPRIFWLLLLTVPLTLSRTGILLGILILVFRFVKKRLWQISLAGVALALILLIPGSPDSWAVRLTLLTAGIETVIKSPLWGLGLGNFVATTSALHFQPVHNVFVLALSELGALLFIVLFLKILKNLFRLSGIGLSLILITATADHYWWTLPQMQLLLTIFLAVAVQLNHGGICGIYRWWGERKSGPSGLRLRSIKSE